MDNMVIRFGIGMLIGTSLALFLGLPRLAIAINYTIDLTIIGGGILFELLNKKTTH